MTLKKKGILFLQPSEGIVVRAAADIYSAYIIAGRVEEGKEKQWRDRAVREAYDIATTTDSNIVSDAELD